ncbi:flagellar basal body rod protein FlgC [Roseomonas marmotae]|uniref:Flagellar basal-body rod protein FlgC n=1 Tax=Roseomonas marmotae TaxID=2768161 RepID=A0ABS3KF86_9PROT|nr:flagellar basal body rod protein FlgC [Roseomonas marmotae]MBO1076132.1 flagellar basal body rod protein FlgC [Roseomonas marmotae]QTI81266.1 flagellar basal body rod protein FlgC [Roseomonas marmotae]
MIRVEPIGGAGPLTQAMATAASGMNSQAVRMRVAAENIANASSTAAVPGGDPYRRKLLSFRQTVDRATGASLLRTGSIMGDQRDFRTQYDPAHPAADALGYVKLPNVDTLLEQADLRGAQRSYEAGIAVMQQARSLYGKTLDILRS